MNTNQIEDAFAEEADCERPRVRTRLMRVVERARRGEGR